MLVESLTLIVQLWSLWQSGKVYFQRCNDSPNSSSVTSDNNVQCSKAVAKLKDLNSPPVTKRTLNLFDDPSLDLPLPAMPTYQSVCTLDKVKSALERADKESGIGRKRSRSTSRPVSPISHSSSSTKEGDLLEQKPSTPVAAGCHCCLMYVLISRSNPKCPRCNSIVPVPVATAPKKLRLDLNISIWEVV